MESFQNSASPFSTQPIFMQLVLILFLAMLGTFVASLQIEGLGQLLGMDYLETIQNLDENAAAKEKNFVKMALCISHLCTFIFPSLIFLWITYKKNWLAPMKLQPFPNLLNCILGALLIIVAFPFVQFIYTINRGFPLPQWAIEQEELINTTLEHLLYVNSSSELFFNLFTIALLPAIGEELLFRGIIQQNIEKGVKNPHIAVWLTALIFSFIHFQFQGFLPRVLLGGILGYLFVWTRNLWIPIIAHLFYNAGQILLQYFHQRGILGLDLNEVETVPIWLIGISIFGVITLGYFLKNRTENKLI